MVLSDNAVTDVVCDRVGLDRVTATMGRLGLTQTAVPLNCSAQFATVAEDLGVSEFPAELTADQVAGLRAMDPGRSRRTTASDITSLLVGILDGTVASPESCAAMRAILGQQV